MDDPGFESQNIQEISILPKGAQPASYSMGTKGSFSRALSEWGEKLLAPHLTTRLRIKATPLPPLHDFMASTKTPPPPFYFIYDEHKQTRINIQLVGQRKLSLLERPICEFCIGKLTMLIEKFIERVYGIHKYITWAKIPSLSC
jgi:hypothetical protein